MSINIMNLMMGTNGMNSTGTPGKEVDGALFSALLEKASGEGEKAKDPFAELFEGEASVSEKESLTDMDMTALFGMYFSKVPLETVEQPKEEILQDTAVGLEKIVQKTEGAGDLNLLNEVLASMKPGDETGGKIIEETVKMPWIGENARKEAEAFSEASSQLAEGQKEAQAAVHEVKLRPLNWKESVESTETPVDKNLSPAHDKENQVLLVQDENTVESSTKLKTETSDKKAEEAQELSEPLANIGAEPQRTAEARAAEDSRKMITEKDLKENLRITEEAMVKSVETLKNGDKTTMKLRLHPEELGEMELTLSMEHGKITGKLFTDSQEIRQLFQGKLLELQETLKAQNIQVAKLEVSVDLSGNGPNYQGQTSPEDLYRRAREMTLRGYSLPSEKKSSYSPAALKSTEGISILA